MSDNKDDWDRSYFNKDNFVFYPHEEVIRFVSKFIRKRIEINDFLEAYSGSSVGNILDLGCGIGRHVMYCHDMGLESYGIDLSDAAIQTAQKWGEEAGLPEPKNRLQQGDVRSLPWKDGFFRYAVSHGVLDSMPFDIARAACVELARVMVSDGLFYCDLISGADSKHADEKEFSGEEIVTTAHENGTIQSYFNDSKILLMINGVFQIEESHLIRRKNMINGKITARYHLVLRRC